MEYTPQELMVAAAAREIHDGEVVFVGMRLPLIAFALARRPTRPRRSACSSAGSCAIRPRPELLYTMGDGPNIAGATWCARMADLMGMLQAGANRPGLSAVPRSTAMAISTPPISARAPRRRSSCRAAAAPSDIACLSQRLLIIMAHERRRFVERVGYITSPGYGDGPGWRERVGLPRGGPAAVITTLGVLGFDPATKEAVLRSYHPGQSPETLRASTGWDLKVAGDAGETPAPTAEELAIIRRYDPQGFWTR